MCDAGIYCTHTDNYHSAVPDLFQFELVGFLRAPSGADVFWIWLERRLVYIPVQAVFPDGAKESGRGGQNRWMWIYDDILANSVSFGESHGGGGDGAFCRMALE